MYSENQEKFKSIFEVRHAFDLFQMTHPASDAHSSTFLIVHHDDGDGDDRRFIVLHLTVPFGRGGRKRRGLRF